MQGGKKEQKQWTQVQAKRMEPKVSQKSVRTIMFQSPHQSQETLKKGENNGT